MPQTQAEQLYFGKAVQCAGSASHQLCGCGQVTVSLPPKCEMRVLGQIP